MTIEGETNLFIDEGVTITEALHVKLAEPWACPDTGVYVFDAAAQTFTFVGRPTRPVPTL